MARRPLLVSCVAAAAIVACLPRRGAAADLPTPDIPQRQPEGFLVLPFVNESRSRAFDWMRVGLPAALAEKLEGHPGLRDASPDATLVTAADAVAAARAGHARWAFAGAFQHRDRELEIRLELWSVDDDGHRARVAERVERGDPAQVFGLLDEAVAALCVSAGRPLPPEAAPPLLRAPTRDLHAFALYGRGLASLVGVDRPPDVERARRELGRSVFVDPRFAEAHRMLGVAYLRLGEAGRARAELARARDLRPRYYAPLATLARLAHDG